MSKIKFQPHFTYYNPYRASDQRLRSDDPSLKKENQSKIIKLAESTITWSGSLLYRDHEKQVDLAGDIANVLDWSTTITTGAIDVALFADSIFPFGVCRRALSKLSLFLSIPSTIAFLGFGVVQGMVELANLQRVSLLYKRLQKREKDPLDKLNWIKDHYFSLRAQESKKIQTFIDKYLKNLSPDQKALKFQKIADKILKNRFHSLKNRITSELAEEVSKQIHIIIKDLKSWNPYTYKSAKVRAEKLMESVSRQAKNKIVIHVLELTAMAISFFSLILTLAGVSSGLILIPLTVLSATFVFMSFLIHKGTLDREVDFFHEKLKEFKLPIEAGSIDLREFVTVA